MVASPSAHPDRIGPYHITRVIGEGGMGVVYEAEQKKPVRRRVAVKMMKLGMDTREVVKRFEAERQALAVMDHPNIAKVFDGGATDEGRPYFVMELMPGTPITRFCDARELTTRERIELCISVCRAIQHAHQKGVVHRDLKPSNVLVRSGETGPMVKVIDFGIAKAVGSAVADQTALTRLGQFVGTPEYMSPEQAEGSMDVDTRTDIYSLGVLLYELLVGAPPLDFGAVPDPAVAYALREREAERPSTRLTRLGSDADDIAGRRGTDRLSLIRELKGDLDWIVMKAIDKDRSHRYETANGLAMDLERYLANEPVFARPPSATYRLRKFVRRHRLSVAFSTALALLIVSFAVATAVQANLVARERDRAESAATRAAAINDFMEETLLSPDPLSGEGRDVTVAEALGAAAARVDSTLGDTPETAATARAAIGWAYHRLGRYTEAEPLLRDALRQREELLAERDPELAESAFQWASQRHVAGDYAEAETYHQRALRIREGVTGQEESVVESHIALGRLFTEVGRLDEAEEQLRTALALAEAHDRESRTVAAINNHLGVVLWNKGELDDVAPIWERALELRRARLGDEHPEVGETMNNLAVLYDNTGRAEEAEPLYRQALALQRELLGPEHEEVTSIMTNLAILLDEAGKWDEAEQLYRDVLAIDSRRLGQGHLFVGYDLVNLGAFLCNVGKAEEGTPAMERSIPLHEDNLEPDHWRIGNARQWYGFCLTKLTRFAEAEEQIRAGMTLLSDALGADHYRVDAARRKLIDVYEAWGRIEAAEAERALLGGER